MCELCGYNYGYDGQEEFGCSFPLESRIKSLSEVEEIVNKLLLPDAIRTVGKGVTVEIRATAPLTVPTPRISWYTTDYIKSCPKTGLISPTQCRDGGFMNCGRIST